MNTLTRRSLLSRLRNLGMAVPFVSGLPVVRELQAAGAENVRSRRVILFFTPNGTIPQEFWPVEKDGELQFGRILAPLERWKSRCLALKGISNKVRGDGDGHMRGMSCLLTGIELFPGNIQGGSDTPAGWASGISIDQELKNFHQANAASRTRFGSLELGVAVPDRADPWTRWSYAGPNQPMTPMDDPGQVLRHLYGHLQEREALGSVLDHVSTDLRGVAGHLPSADRDMLERHLTFVREMEASLQEGKREVLRRPPPEFPEGGRSGENDAIPETMKRQTALLVNAFANDLARVATYQFTNSVGNARPTWVGVQEGHHALSHDPDLNADSQDKLIRINEWLGQQLASLVGQLDETPDPSGDGSLLDHTTVIWTNELGKGNSHSHDNIPFLLIGGGHGFRTGRAMEFRNVAHNRLWLSLAHASGHMIPTFGNASLCEGGPLDLS